MNVHDFSVKTADGGKQDLRDYAGEVLLIVNVASRCGLTPQYEGLEALYREGSEHGLRVLGFPCNQFGAQEPGSDAEIQQFCRTSYGVTFPVLGKIDVNGPGADPLFTYLRAQAPVDLGPATGPGAAAPAPAQSGTGDIVWNFTKFLVGRDGNVVRRYGPGVTPEELRPDLESLLSS
jgi:glutathione peroxidase